MTALKHVGLLFLAAPLQSITGFRTLMASSSIAPNVSSKIRFSPTHRIDHSTACTSTNLFSTSSESLTATTTTTTTSRATPSLIVLDLDNTIWTPELFQLRKLQRENVTPTAHVDVKLFPGAQTMLESLRESRSNPSHELHHTKFAIASRTKSGEWAHDLLRQFDIVDLFDFVEIFTGDKKKHFANLKTKSGIDFGEMLFFDDNRDGKFGNCVPVSELGVLSVHCPGGLHNEEVFTMGMTRYAEWAPLEERVPTIIEWDGAVSTLKSRDDMPQQNSLQRMEGVVKMVNYERKFGFIRYGKRNTKDLFFHFSSLPQQADVNKGDKLSFLVENDDRNNKSRATEVEILSPTTAAAKNSNNDTISVPLLEETNKVTIRTFSMNLPFAALLANKYKTLETRNGTMFVPYPSGTKMLLHVGQRTYPDGNRHLDVMKSGGLSDDEITALKSLPKGYNKGQAVAIVELGDTYETTVEERSVPEFQRNVAAFGADSGRMVTEIKRVEYLKKGIRVSGRGGVFKSVVDANAIPEGWLS